MDVWGISNISLHLHMFYNIWFRKTFSYVLCSHQSWASKPYLLEVRNFLALFLKRLAGSGETMKQNGAPIWPEEETGMHGTRRSGAPKTYGGGQKKLGKFQGQGVGGDIRTGRLHQKSPSEELLYKALRKIRAGTCSHCKKENLFCREYLDSGGRCRIPKERGWRVPKPTTRA